MIPVENSGVTEGYVTYHYDMQQLYQKRSGLLGILQIGFFCRVCLVRTAPSLLSEMDPYSNATDHQGGLPNMPTEI